MLSEVEQQCTNSGMHKILTPLMLVWMFRRLCQIFNGTFTCKKRHFSIVIIILKFDIHCPFAGSYCPPSLAIWAMPKIPLALKYFAHAYCWIQYIVAINPEWFHVFIQNCGAYNVYTLIFPLKFCVVSLHFHFLEEKKSTYMYSQFVGSTFAFVNFMVIFFNASDVDTLLLIYFTNSFSILHVLTCKIRMTYYKIGKCM